MKQARKSLEIAQKRVAGVARVLDLLSEQNTEDAEALAILAYELEEAHEELDGVAAKLKG